MTMIRTGGADPLSLDGCKCPLCVVLLFSYPLFVPRAAPMSLLSNIVCVSPSLPTHHPCLLALSPPTDAMPTAHICDHFFFTYLK